MRFGKVKQKTLFSRLNVKKTARLRLNSAESVKIQGLI